MANTAAPFGFRQLRRLDGGSPTAGFEVATILSSDTNTYFTGDPVASGTDGNITVPSSGAVQIKGVFMGCEYYNASVNRIVFSAYFPGNVSAGNTITGWVCTDPQMLYIAQCSTAATVGSSRRGENIAFTAATSSLGNTLSGISAVSLNPSDIGTSSSYPWRIYDLYSNYAPPGTNGTDNTTAGQILVVAPNNFDRTNLVGV